jgi:hypothetical protein
MPIRWPDPGAEEERDVGGRLTIIGGGAMGLMAACHAAPLADAVTVLERSRVGDPATASFGLTRSVRNDFQDPAYARLAFEARQLWRELERESGERLLIDCGCLNLVKDSVPPDLDRTYAVQSYEVLEQLRLRREVFSRAQLAERFPQFDADGGWLDVVGWRGTGYKFAPWVGKVLAQQQPACQICAGLLHPILPPVGLAGAQSADRVLHAAAAVRTPLGAGEPALQPPQPRPLPRSQARRVQQFTRRQRRADHNATVDADYLAGTRCRDRIGYGSERDMPSPCAIQRHPVGLHPWRHCAGPAEPNPPGLRYPHLADFTAQAPYLPLSASSHDPEPLVLPGPPRRRPPGWVLRVKERCHCLGEVPERLLLYCLGAVPQPLVLCPGQGQLSALLQVVGCAPPARMPVLVLLDRQVPHVPGVRAVNPQHRLLGSRGEQSVAGHTNTLAMITDISEEVKRRFLPRLKARFCTPRFL